MKFVSWAKTKDDAFKAIKACNTELVVKMIEENPRLLTAYNVSGYSLLHLVAETDNVELLDILVRRGLDVNIVKKNDKVNGKCTTPLHNAAEYGAISAIDWLIEHGAIIDAGNGIHSTPLVDAAMRGHLEAAKLLIEKGADVNACYYIGEGKEKSKFNALSWAETKGYQEIARLLRSKGAEDIVEVEDEKEYDIINRQDEVQAHIEKYLGKISTTLGEIIPGSRVSVNTHIIMPSEGKNWITLVTSGMSDCAMDNSEEAEGYEFAELLIRLPANWPIDKEQLKDINNYWPFGWLKQMAHIPHMYDGWLSEGNIIPNQEPPRPFSSNTSLSCLMISRPKEKALSKLKCKDGAIVNFYTLVPIYEEERYIALNRGYEYLLKLLNKRGLGDVLDVQRENVGM